MKCLKMFDEFFGLTEWVYDNDGDISNDVSAEDRRWIAALGWFTLAIGTLIYVAIIAIA